MEAFSPFSIQIPLLFAVTLLGSYLIGWLFYKSPNGVDNLAGRLALGHVALLVLVSVVYAGIGTMAVLLIPLFLFLAYQRFGLKSVGTPVERNSAPAYEYLGLVIVAAAFFLLDAIRMDIRLNETLLYIGNTDIAFYGSNGRMMFEMGEETLPSSVGATSGKMVYHFGDMWLSGIYSYFFDVIPYYAYGVLYRSVSTSILFVLLFSFFRKGKGYVIALLLSLLALVANHALLGYFPSFGIDLLQPFATSWPIYAESSYLILGIAALVFIKLIQEGRRSEGLIGFLLTAGLHSAFIVPSFIFAVIQVGFRLFLPKLYLRTGAPVGWIHVGLIAVSGIAGYAFVVLDGRSLSMPLEASTSVLYLTVHTFFRTTLTILLLAPFAAGIGYLITQKKFRTTAIIVIGYCVAGIAGFCLLFAIFQSPNTIKLLNSILSVLLFPLGIWGLSELLNESRIWRRAVGAVSISLVVISTAIGCFQTSNFESIYTWNNISGHQEKWTLRADDVNVLRKSLTQGVYAGYAVCNEELFEGDLIRYNSFVGVNGLLDGGHIFRLNAIGRDTTGSIESTSWALKSVPVIIAQNHKEISSASVTYIKEIGISYLIQDQEISGLCFPKELGLEAIESVNTSRYNLQRIVVE
ncbi:MAG TPA: hypothetical protein DCR04_12535 [Flavobacteriales bacterium]|nr:hypothetical protein [Flavobacteriales bacterium]